MRHYHCANHSALVLQHILKRLSGDDVHNIGNFETYFIFAIGKED